MSVNRTEFHEKWGDRPVRIISLGDRRMVILYVLVALALAVHAVRIEVLNNHVDGLLREQCVADNGTADVWNRIVARSIAQEQKSTTDSAEVKADKIAQLHAITFPHQAC